MEWLQVMTIAGSTLGACWLMHRENIKMHQDFSKEMKDFHDCMKEFHGRLCTLEERYLQMMHRSLEDRK